MKTAAGPIGGDAEGNRWGLFRRHCAACHGISGDGAGPSAAVLNPYPRDFRNGVFKYTSTAAGAKPLPDDLLRTLRQGIPGTAMPSFRKLPDRELGRLLEYVKYLSIRGQTELYLLVQVVDEDAAVPLVPSEITSDAVAPAAKSWDDAQSSRHTPCAVASLSPKPPPKPPCEPANEADGTRSVPATAIARGDALFHGPAVDCARCHGPLGDGNGRQSALYNDWNKRKIGATPDETARLARRFRLPAQPLHPRNFTQERFRGGDRPIDQYWRISVGIKGTPMPPFGPSTNSTGPLTPEQIWDVVSYVRSLGIAKDGVAGGEESEVAGP